jgi:hypothetical protein
LSQKEQFGVLIKDIGKNIPPHIVVGDVFIIHWGGRRFNIHCIVFDAS